MPRGFVWCLYIDDAERPFVLRVDADLALLPEAGWVQTDEASMIPFPREWRPRRVYGWDAEGNLRFRRVATTTCDLWTGAVDTFQIQGTDNLAHSVIVLGRQMENTRRRPRGSSGIP
jgi:hypothetical protein